VPPHPQPHRPLLAPFDVEAQHVTALDSIDPGTSQFVDVKEDITKISVRWSAARLLFQDLYETETAFRDTRPTSAIRALQSGQRSGIDEILKSDDGVCDDDHKYHRSFFD
jgi:hypothetical protein